MRPTRSPIVKAAFYSRELVQRSNRASLDSVRDAEAKIKKLRGQGRPIPEDLSVLFREMQVERSLIAQYIQVMAALEGNISSAPNPRQRAMEELWELNMRGDVKRGTGRAIERRIREQDRQNRKQPTRDARAAEGLPNTPSRPKKYTPREDA